MDNEILRRLLWAGVVAASSAIASLAATKAANIVWVRVFNEEPPK